MLTSPGEELRCFTAHEYSIMRCCEHGGVARVRMPNSLFATTEILQVATNWALQLKSIDVIYCYYMSAWLPIVDT